MIKNFIFQKILVHSRSRTVLATLKEAHSMHKRLYIYVTECASNDSGRKMKKDLDALGIPCTLVLDGSVGYVLEQVDLVLLGAEGVVESGGIVNKVIFILNSRNILHHQTDSKCAVVILEITLMHFW